VNLGIRNFTPYKKNILLGFLDVVTPDGLVVYGLSVHQRDRNRWLGMPSRPFQKNGTTGYTAVVEFISREACDKFRDKVLEALNRYQHGGRA
jgi:DNA-binding cell septation regulator SpoVG